MEYIQIILTIVAALISAMLPFFMQYLSNEIQSIKKSSDEADEHLKEKLSSLDIALIQMQHTESERFAREQERMAQEQNRMDEFIKFQDGIKAVLRDRILQGRRYFCEKKYIPAAEYENIESMYKAYSDLGGNGLAEKAFKELSKLPFERSDKE